ncbi:MAG: NINE protein [Ginsengibacter sp.]|jgi:TM2 domain-containing membrane protein YozV
MNISDSFSSLNPILLKYLYDVSPEELLTINSRIKQYSPDEITQFCILYRSKRRDPQLILVLTLLGLFGVAGIHRIILGHIGLGIVYFLTIGLCWIGTIVDAVNFKRLSLEYNSKMIAETMMVLNMVR